MAHRERPFALGEGCSMRTKGAGLWLRNTSRYADEEIWWLCRAAYDSTERSLKPGQRMPNIIVKLTNCSRAYRGRAYWTEWRKDHPNEMATEWKRILVRVGAPGNFP